MRIVTVLAVGGLAVVRLGWLLNMHTKHAHFCEADNGGCSMSFSEHAGALINTKICLNLPKAITLTLTPTLC